MIEARKERVRELIRSLELVKVRTRALCDEGSAFEARSSSSTNAEAGKIRKMQPTPPAKTRRHLKCHRSHETPCP